LAPVSHSLFGSVRLRKEYGENSARMSVQLPGGAGSDYRKSFARADDEDLVNMQMDEAELNG